MIINKYQGKTRDDAIAKAKQELGPDAVVMNVKEIKPKGMLKVFKGSTFEVTAALEEREKFQNSGQPQVAPMKRRDGISLAADEKIDISKIQQHETAADRLSAQLNKARVEATGNAGNASNAAQGGVSGDGRSTATPESVSQSLAGLSNILDKKLSQEAAQGAGSIRGNDEGGDAAENRTLQQGSAKPADQGPKSPQQTNPRGFQFIKMLYRTMIENEVNEIYVNQILDEAEKIMRNGSNVDYILSNVYQKMILKFGEPKGIALDGKKPRVIFFIGPTGVGKTTTIAKIASKHKVELSKRVAFLTADTYRIAATEQLRVYANILNAPMSVIYTGTEMNEAIGRLTDYDLIFVDTAGFSHKNDSQRGDMKRLIAELDPKYQKEVYLVVSATTKCRDLLEIADVYKEIADYKLLFTKLDETTTYGNMLNLRMYSDADMSYTANGQNVPDDIEEFDTQKIVKLLLGGR